MAQGVTCAVFAKHGFARAIHLDSAGIHVPHEGEAPDARAQQIATAGGYDLSGLKSRKVLQSDFAEFDLILAMDRTNLADLHRRCPDEYRHKVRLFLSDAERGMLEIPDPYYGSLAGFENVLDLCEQGAEALLAAVRQEKNRPDAKHPDYPTARRATHGAIGKM